MTEKRRKKRVPKRLTVKFGEGEPTTNGIVLDLSTDGAFVTASALPPLGARIRMRVEQGKNVLYFEARVRRHRARAANPTLQQLEPNGFGVSFLQPSELVAELLGQKSHAQPSPGSLVVRVESAAHLLGLWRAELSLGGVFLVTELSRPRDAQVVVALLLTHAEQCLEFRARVLQEVNGQVHGLALQFEDPSAVLVALRPFVTEAGPAIPLGDGGPGRGTR